MVLLYADLYIACLRRRRLLLFFLLFIPRSFYHFTIAFVSAFSLQMLQVHFMESPLGISWENVYIWYNKYICTIHVCIVMLFWDGPSFAAAVYFFSIFSIIINIMCSYVWVSHYLTTSLFHRHLNCECFRIVLFPIHRNTE